MNKALLLVAAASALAAASCAKGDAARTAPPTDVRPAPTAQSEPASPEKIEIATGNDPWYSERLGALGFYVFPKPEPLPAFTVKTMGGDDFGVAKLSGSVVLLNFWATWCPPCRMEMPSIQALDDAMKGKAFKVMAVSVGEKKSTVEGFLKSNPYTYPIYLDESGEASAPFAGRGIPTTFILDKQGRAIAGIVGSRSYDGPEVIGLFKELAERLP